MSHQRVQWVQWVWFVAVVVTAAATGCADARQLASDDPGPGDASEVSWAALMDDGDVGAIAPAAATRPPPMTPPSRSCGGDCARLPLARWTLDDCRPDTTELFDDAFTSGVEHHAFRSVSAACAEGREGLGVRLSGGEDIVYAPDQPDFVFDQGITLAVWINPDRVTATQSIARKRLDSTSAVVLAIDGKRLNFVLRLQGGRLVGVSAPIAARRFTHVAATYDGKEAILYLDGAVAARARARGTIAPGAGPLFFGNDASGRAFKGVLDTLWLNTLAAPPDAVASLTCVHRAPVAAFTPTTTPPTPGGTAVPFDLAITNANDTSCGPSDYQVFASNVFFPLSAQPFFSFVTLAPGETAHVPINVTSSPAAAEGSYGFQYLVGDAARFSLQAIAEATYVVAAPVPVTKTGCTASPPVAVAPGGYYVNGNTICTADGRQHQLHGVDRPSLEWQSGGANLSLADFRRIATWNANVVRIALNQDFWLADSPISDPNYPGLVDNAIHWAEMAGMDVILDLHWSDRGVLGSCPPSNGCQQLAPDANSIEFWSEVAARYRDDGRVMFELYNEPHDISWDVWRNGGDTGQGWQAAGMQQLADAVRAAGAHNLLLIGGVDWAFDLSGVPANRIDGFNIVYVTHPYLAFGGRAPDTWPAAFGFLAETDPVVATEFGDLTGTCATDYAAQLIQYADTRGMGWTAWAWFPGGCNFTALIEDWAGTPSPLGAVIKPALLGYDDPPASPPRPGTDRPTDVSYLFENSSEGWAFNLYDAPDISNLFLHPPAGQPAPTLRFDGTDGDPAPGALKLTTTFTALDQFVGIDVALGFPGVNPTSKTVHARIKLVSGTIPEGGVQLYGSSGATFAFFGGFHDASEFPAGTWVPVELDLTTAPADFDPSALVEIGVQVFSGFAAGGGTFSGSGTVVFEIDSVTD